MQRLFLILEAVFLGCFAIPTTLNAQDAAYYNNRANDIHRGDTVVVFENTTLRLGQQVIAEVASGSQFWVSAISGDWVGVRGIANGMEREGWVERRVLTKANHLSAYGGETSPSVYGSSIITFDNQSGEPALVMIDEP